MSYTTNVFHLLAAVVLIRLLAQTAGIDLAMADTCVQECEQGGGERDDDCNTGCGNCLCCSHHRIVALPPGTTLTPPAILLAIEFTHEAPRGAARADEIMKVPKALLGA